jgi:hypothetical protein
MSNKAPERYKQSISGHFVANRHRTLADELRREEMEKLAHQEKVKWGEADPSIRDLDRSYRPMGEGVGRRQPVRYE